MSPVNEPIEVSGSEGFTYIACGGGSVMVGDEDVQRLIGALIDRWLSIKADYERAHNEPLPFVVHRYAANERYLADHGGDDLYEPNGFLRNEVAVRMEPPPRWWPPGVDGHAVVKRIVEYLQAPDAPSDPA